MGRVFILGAGFSKPAGMPLATELLPMLEAKLELEDMQKWLGWLGKRIAWLDGGEGAGRLNIEQVFHLANFDVEAFRLKQHLERVGRQDGYGLAWEQADSISAWLSYLEDELREVIIESQDAVDLRPILRFAKSLQGGDGVVTFNYDLLVERAITAVGGQWTHGFETDREGTLVCKMHGSIDWIVADRRTNLDKLDKLFDKPNENRPTDGTPLGHVEEDCRLWRCRDAEQLNTWIKGRHFQTVIQGGMPSYVGIAGLGSYKQLHQVPGLGLVWNKGMTALYRADSAVVVGFSLSDFDAMAQLQFAEVAMARVRDGNPLRVTVVDPFLNEPAKERFKRVFRTVEFVACRHEEFDWNAPSA